MTEPRDVERAEKALTEWHDEAGVHGPYQGQAELVAGLMAEARRQSAMLPGAPHEDPADCPAFYDGCHCDVEALVHNVDRAEKAEAEAARLRKALEEARGRALHGCRQCWDVVSVVDAALCGESPPEMGDPLTAAFERGRAAGAAGAASLVNDLARDKPPKVAAFAHSASRALFAKARVAQAAAEAAAEAGQEA